MSDRLFDSQSDGRTVGPGPDTSDLQAQQDAMLRQSGYLPPTNDQTMIALGDSVSRVLDHLASPARPTPDQTMIALGNTVTNVQNGLGYEPNPRVAYDRHMLQLAAAQDAMLRASGFRSGGLMSQPAAQPDPEVNARAQALRMLLGGMF